MVAKTEYFLLASYSCLLTVTAQLERLRQIGQTAVLFCFTEPLYEFLRPLSAQFPWITINLINEQPVWRIRQPLTLLQARMQTKTLYHQYFAGIPDGSIVYFYNRHAALFLFYIIWQLRHQCQLYYTECDPVAMYTPFWSLKSGSQWLAFSFVYPAPLEMVRPKSKQSTIALPAISEEVAQEIVCQIGERVLNTDGLKSSSVYQALQWRSSAKILWIMGMVLDMDEVEAVAYDSLLTQCFSLFPADEQLVKFHPRARCFEHFGRNIVNRVPAHIPAEFLAMGELIAVITISSTANTAISLTSNVKIISLVEMLPFTNESIRDRHRQVMQQVVSRLYKPTDFTELRQIFEGLKNDRTI